MSFKFVLAFFFINFWVDVNHCQDLPTAVLDIIKCFLEPLSAAINGSTPCAKLTPINQPLSSFDGFYYVQERSARPNESPPKCSTSTIKTLGNYTNLALNQVFTEIPNRNITLCFLNFGQQDGIFFSIKLDDPLLETSELRYVVADENIGFVHAVCTSEKTFVTLGTKMQQISIEATILEQKAAENKLNISQYTLAKINQANCKNQNQGGIGTCVGSLTTLAGNLIKKYPEYASNCVALDPLQKALNKLINPILDPILNSILNPIMKIGG